MSLTYNELFYKADYFIVNQVKNLDIV